MKEIGGYFGLEELRSREYYPDLVAVNNSRNALLYILKAKHIKKLYIPYFLCDTVYRLCESEGVLYEFYHIDENFNPLFDKRIGNGEALYIVNYYGQITNERVLKKKYGNIIFDNVQAFFRKPRKGIDTVYSCRKFFGVPDGGYAACDCRLDEELPNDVSMNRMKHILGRYEAGTASDYYADFSENDESFYNLELRSMSKLTHNILGAIDYASVKRKREENFAELSKLLKNENLLKLRLPEGPYAYPFLCKDGEKIRKALVSKKIYVPTLWRGVDGSPTEIEYAVNILPLPCDQRYGKEDMLRIAEEIKNARKS